ncbi:fumarylacetoacetate (FAA) hydrolase family protein [Phyllobacterium endophyticum]|nr:fumarylacetoacetate (FAA) hydrolase family protein [Phyllobacterium endophyticum]
MIDPKGRFVGRVWRRDLNGPSIVALRGERIVDITSKRVPTMRDLLELLSPAEYMETAAGQDLGSFNTEQVQGEISLLAPFDLQAIKACGVTFASSMIERLIEERAVGSPSDAARIRGTISGILGGSLRSLKAGSPEAAEIKRALIKEGVWSQHLEVGIGPDAEVFTKSQVMSSVGHGG